MSLADVLDLFLEISEACRAEEALALSLTCAAWHDSLARPAIWQRYLQGPPDALARPVLADPVAAAAFAAVHPANLRAVVAALRSTGWVRRYPIMRKRLAAGALVGRLSPRKVKPNARQSKARILRDVRRSNKARCDKNTSVAFQGQRMRDLQRAIDTAITEQVLSDQAKMGAILCPGTPKRRNDAGTPLDLSMTPPRSTTPKRRLQQGLSKTPSPLSRSLTSAGKREMAASACRAAISSSSTSSSSSSSSSTFAPQHSQASLAASSSTGSGRSYEGDLLDGKPHGHGVRRWSCGRMYEGEFLTGKMHGNGRLLDKDGRIYNGSFVRSRPQGFGALHENDGTLYQGEFVKGRRQGQGTQRFADGRVYVGQFAAGQPHGRGILRSHAGTLMFDGLFQKGRVLPQNGATPVADVLVSARPESGHPLSRLSVSEGK